MALRYKTFTVQIPSSDSNPSCAQRVEQAFEQLDKMVNDLYSQMSFTQARDTLDDVFEISGAHFIKRTVVFSDEELTRTGQLAARPPV